MGSAVCNFIVSQLLLDFFVRISLPPIRFLLLVGNVVPETPHRTEVRLQNEENAPVVPPNKKFLFSKMKAGKYGSKEEHSNTTQLMTKIKAGCDTARSFMGKKFTSWDREQSGDECDVNSRGHTQKWRHKKGIFAQMKRLPYSAESSWITSKISITSLSVLFCAIFIRFRHLLGLLGFRGFSDENCFCSPAFSSMHAWCDARFTLPSHYICDESGDYLISCAILITVSQDCLGHSEHMLWTQGA